MTSEIAQWYKCTSDFLPYQNSFPIKRRQDLHKYTGEKYPVYSRNIFGKWGDFHPTLNKRKQCRNGGRPANHIGMARCGNSTAYYNVHR